MPPMDDLEWLQQYASQNSDEAFERVVRQHVSFVYSAALRQVRDPQLAEEITQAAFVILARKAGRLRKGTVLSGWLFNTVRYIAAAEFRAAARRRRYEQEAAMESLSQGGGADEELWQHLAPHLDECLAELGEVDRRALLLRFFERKSFSEVGEALGTNEDAATKRARRAVEKLRLGFARRGLTLSAAALGGLLAAHSVQAAPAALAASVKAVAVAQGVTATASTAGLIKGGLKFMAWTKLKTAAISAGVLLALGLGTATVTHVSRHADAARLKHSPDGSFMRLLQVAYVTNFNYSVPAPKPWQRKLAERLPSAMLSSYGWWLGNSASMSIGIPSGHTNLIVVTAGERVSSVVNPRLQLTQECLFVSDEQGNESLGSFGASTLGNDDSKHFRTIKAWDVSAFPRRAPQLGLRFMRKTLDDADWHTALEFHIANPAFGNYPTWTPEPLPATKTDGDLTVTLTALTSGLKLHIEDPGLPGNTTVLPATRAVLKLEPGAAAKMWQAKSVEISDATGNKWTPFDPMTFVKQVGDHQELTFGSTLWNTEAAWKLRIEFSRVSGFEADEIWTVRGILVPTAKQVIKLGNSTTRGESALQLVAITGASARQPGDFQWLMVPAMVNLSLHTTQKTTDERVSLVAATDDRGRAVEVKPAPDWDSGNNVFGLSIPAGAQTLDCSFVLHRSRYVEFLAKPEFAPGTIVTVAQ